MYDWEVVGKVFLDKKIERLETDSADDAYAVWNGDNQNMGRLKTEESGKKSLQETEGEEDRNTKLFISWSFKLPHPGQRKQKNADVDDDMSDGSGDPKRKTMGAVTFLILAPDVFEWPALKEGADDASEPPAHGHGHDRVNSEAELYSGKYSKIQEKDPQLGEYDTCGPCELDCKKILDSDL